MDGTIDKGFVCPNCGGFLAVSYGKDIAGGRSRMRRCDRCLYRAMTSEVIKRILPPIVPPQINSINRTTFGQDGVAAEF